ncbi:LPS assembly lipoprotein LptE [Thioclava sp. FR2]|uniref:LPS assembly lipoprotein LptE n=1 Tax=Thioclava sp. FR2 TaxID=3445780 RepID=UPI003EB73096
MSSFNRRSLILLPLALAACGFSPAYAPGSPASKLQGSIRVAEPSDKAGFDLVERLEERLGLPSQPRYALNYTIKTRSSQVGITPDNTIQRFHLTGSVEWSLISTETDARVAGGKVENFAAFSATGSTVAGLAAEEEASLRLMRMLADQIVTRLIATAGTWAEQSQ